MVTTHDPKQTKHPLGLSLYQLQLVSTAPSLSHSSSIRLPPFPFISVLFPTIHPSQTSSHLPCTHHFINCAQRSIQINTIHHQLPSHPDQSNSYSLSSQYSITQLTRTLSTNSRNLFKMTSSIVICVVARASSDDMATYCEFISYVQLKLSLLITRIDLSSNE